MAARACTIIGEFPEDDLLWRVALLGGISRNASVESEPKIEVLLSRVPDGDDVDPLGIESRRSGNTTTAEFGVGQLPEVEIGSLWRHQQLIPLAKQLEARYRRKLHIDSKHVRVIPLSELSREKGPLHKSEYAFHKNWPLAATTNVVAIPHGNDPYGVLIPVVVLIKFYYASSTRLAKSFFWGTYGEHIVPEGSGPIDNGNYRLRLRSTASSSDAWMLARYHASPIMQAAAKRFADGWIKHSTDSSRLRAEPYRAMECGFPFSGPTKLDVQCVSAPGPIGNAHRHLVLRINSCSAPFPFRDLTCLHEGHGKHAEPGAPGGQEPLKRYARNDYTAISDGAFHSDEEPAIGDGTQTIPRVRDRFPDLKDKHLAKEYSDGGNEKRNYIPKNTNFRGRGTGDGTYGDSTLKKTVTNTVEKDGSSVCPQEIPQVLDGFFDAIAKLAKDKDLGISISYIRLAGKELSRSKDRVAAQFPGSAGNKSKVIAWSWVPIDADKARCRNVAIVEVTVQQRTCYLFEAERKSTHDKLGTLVIAAKRFGCIEAKEVESFLLNTAKKGRWSDWVLHRRGMVPHRPGADINARLRRKIFEVLQLAEPTEATLGEPSERGPRHTLPSDVVAAD